MDPIVCDFFRGLGNIDTVVFMNIRDDCRKILTLSGSQTSKIGSGAVFRSDLLARSSVLGPWYPLAGAQQVSDEGSKYTAGQHKLGVAVN